MAEQPHILDDDADGELTQLVSYLDGELEDVDVHAIEQRLIEDPDLRSHADILSRTWAMLDELEEVSASQQFTEDTLATVSMEATRPSDDAQASLLRRCVAAVAYYRIVPLFLMGVIGTFSGLWLANRAVDRRESTGPAAASRLLLDHYDLIRRAEAYSAVPDAQRLRDLNLTDERLSSATAIDGASDE